MPAKKKKHPPKPKGPPQIQRIWLHYKTIGVGERWPIEKFYALCRYMQVTEEELAALVCAPRSMLVNWKAKKSVPGPSALVLELIRQFYTTQKTGVWTPPIMPIHVVLNREEDTGAKSVSDSPITKPPSTTTEASNG